MSKQKQSSSTDTKRVYLGRAAWVKHVAAYHESGLTQPVYAKKANINLTTFHNWVSKLRREQQSLPATESSSAFVPVNITPAAIPALDANTSGLSCELNITLPNGIQCTFPTNHSQQLIVPWLDYLRMLP